MRARSVPGLLLACAAAACASDSVETSQHISMIVNGVNAFGERVGFLEIRPGFPRATWQGPNGVMIDLGTLPGGSRSSAVAIDDAGTIAGQSETAGGAFHAVRWRHGIIQDLGTLPGGDFSVASAIAGDAVLGESTARDGTLHAFRWHDGTLTDLGRFSPPGSGAAPPPPGGRR
jgi:probable HAF family extracellular repeat protein